MSKQSIQRLFVCGGSKGVFQLGVLNRYPKVCVIFIFIFIFFYLFNVCGCKVLQAMTTLIRGPVV